MNKIVKIIIGILLLIITIYTIYFGINYNSDYEKYTLNQPEIDQNKLHTGDILVRHFIILDYLLPGYFTHAGIYAGLDENNNPSVYEAFIWGGVRQVTLKQYMSKGKTYVNRINDLPSEDLNQLVNWVKLNLGKPFTINGFGKNKDGTAFYCSEFVWAAFMHIDINLDSDTFIKLNVTPQEIYDSNYITHLGIIKTED